MGKKLNTQEFVEKARQVHNDKYDYSKTEYVTSRQKVVIICPEHGEFLQLPSSHLQGSGCPECAKKWSEEHKSNLQASARKSRGMTTEEWILRARQIHGDKYDYSQTVYVNQRTSVKIMCPIHGLFEQKADSHIRGCGCRLCGLESENRKGVHFWTEEQRKKIAKTCQERYGASRYLDSEEGQKRITAIKSKADYRQKMHDIIVGPDVQSKTQETCLHRYGVTSPMKLEFVKDKTAETKRRNGTWSTSKPEEDMYIYLLQRFGESDVCRQYKDVRYPFRCDFYIKSLDLFIELNATWLHGGHWFDKTDKCDQKLLSSWKEKLDAGKCFYQVAIDVWTVRDVKKYQTALNNHLNYLVFWKNDLSDFMEWLNSDKLILNNIAEIN